MTSALGLKARVVSLACFLACVPFLRFFYDFLLNGRLVHLTNLFNLLNAFQTSGSNLIKMRHSKFTMAGNFNILC